MAYVMRILHVIDNLTPGGTERQCFALAPKKSGLETHDGRPVAHSAGGADAARAPGVADPAAHALAWLAQKVERRDLRSYETVGEER